MKYKVKCIAISLKGNKVARAGDLIDHTQLPVPENHSQMEADGYLEHTAESKAYAKSVKKGLKKAQEKSDKKQKERNEKLEVKQGITEMTIAELQDFAEENDIELDEKKTKKGQILGQVLGALDAREEEEDNDNKESEEEEE